MLKKIVIGVVILGIAAVAFLAFSTVYVVDEAIKQKEPELRQYVQMTDEQQWNYVMNNFNAILADAKLEQDMSSEDRKQLEGFERIKDDPAVQKATVELGRCILAKALMRSEAIVKDMSADVKEKYQKEADELMTRMDNYSNVREAAEARLK